MANRSVDKEFVEALEASPPSLEQIRALLRVDPGMARRAHVERESWPPLMIACQNPETTEDIIDFLIEQWPESVRFSDSEDSFNAVHLACHNGAPCNVIKTLLNHWPESASISSELGIPLHYCLITDFRADHETLEIVKCLLQACPETITANDPRGDLPIHLAICARAGLKTISLLANKEPEALLSYSGRGCLPIHHAIQFCPLLTVQHLVGLCPRSLHTKTSKSNHLGPFPENKLPLQLACKYAYDLDVFKYLLENCPRDFDPTCLLHDVYEQVSGHHWMPTSKLEVAKYIIHEFPQSVKAKNQLGEIPLHAVVKVPTSALVIENNLYRHTKSLIEQYPHGLFVKTPDGKTPLDLCHRFFPNVRSYMTQKAKIVLSHVLNAIAEENNVPGDVLQLVLPFVI